MGIDIFITLLLANCSFMDHSLLPSISCLCVTRGKPAMLKRVIGCFREQQYSNKQLVVVYETDDRPTEELLRTEIRPDEPIRIVPVSAVPDKKTLGELRNLSIAAADGEYVCQWDDDDWYDPERLAIQVARMRSAGKEACILSRWVVFDATTGAAYLSNRRLWEGSILCRRETMLKNPYPRLPKGEDTTVIRQLYDRNMLEIIDNEPEIYVYTYHGGNTWEQGHFQQIFDRGTRLGADYEVQIRSLLHI